MRRRMVLLGVVGFLCLSATSLWAGGIINKSNQSADYFRSLTRNAATDAADIVAYNPAGVMKMDNGLYTKLDLLYVAKKYSNSVPNQTGLPYSLFAGEDGDFSSDTPSLIPGFFAVYKQEDWAGFFAVTIPGGGGKIEFDEGSAYTSVLAMSIWGKALALGPLNPYSGLDSAKIEADSYDIGYTLGGAYKINAMFSVAGGLRYVNASQNFKGRVDMTTAPASSAQDVFEVDLERTASGWGGFVGLNVAPVEDLNIGLLYFSNTSLNMESDVKKDTSGGSITSDLGWSDGTKRHEDLPGILGVGVSYRFTPRLRAEVDYTRYLEDLAKLDSKSGRFSSASDSYDFGMSLEYAFNDQWKGSFGYMITDIKGMAPEQLIPLAPELDARTWAFGAAYKPSDRLQFSFGYTFVDYASVTTRTTGSNSPARTELEKETWALSIGAQYRWF
jgi:long-chain fatty acid transport protein